MKFSEFFTTKDNIQLDKRTLVTLRWIALVGQYITINIVNFVFEFELPYTKKTVKFKFLDGIFTSNIYVKSNLTELPFD